MSHTQFSMVEELAFLVKDNLPCKHLVLSMEDMLVDFLHNETNLDQVLELEPMNPYNRLLLHRLADIFGYFPYLHDALLCNCHLNKVSLFCMQDFLINLSVKEMIGKRCEDTSIPSILVADLLWEHDGYQSPLTSQLLTRQEDASTGTKVGTLTGKVSLEDKEAAYLAARKRIFSTENNDMESLLKERPRNNPVAAQRMIAHALGQRVKQSNGGICIKPGKNPSTSQTSLQTSQKSNQHLTSKIEASTNVGAKKYDPNVSRHEEHIGAAKRMFANSLRMHPAKSDKS